MGTIGAITSGGTLRIAATILIAKFMVLQQTSHRYDDQLVVTYKYTQNLILSPTGLCPTINNGPSESRSQTQKMLNRMFIRTIYP